MKKAYRIFIASIAGVVFYPMNAVATENLEVTTFENMRTIRMEVSAPSMEAMNVFLLDKKDEVIFREEIGRGSTFEDSFDFSGISNGTYTLVSEAENIRYNRVLQVTTSGVRLADSYYTFTPRIEVKDGHLFVHHINNGGESLDITIESNAGFLFEAGYASTGVVFQEIISMEGMANGYYTLYLRNNGELFSHDFRVQ